MTDNQILEKVDEAMRLGRKKAYVDMFCIVSDMSVTDSSESLKKLLNILHRKVLSAGAESEVRDADSD